MMNIIIKGAIITITTVWSVFMLVNCSDDPVPSPEIIVNGGITDFGSVDVLSHSAYQDLQIMGSDLTEDLIIDASESFEISLDEINFSHQIIIDKGIANTKNSTIYVRFSPIESAVGSISGTMSLQSAQATTKIMSLSGEGLSITPVIFIDETEISFNDTGVMQVSDSAKIVTKGNYLGSSIGLSVTEGFEISLDGNTYTNALEITAEESNNETTVYVRFAPKIAGEISGTLTVRNNEVDDVEVLLFGVGIAVVDLFILAGQSNAQGWMGNASYYPENGKELDNSILLNWTFVDYESSAGKWVKMQAQTGRFPNGHFGPEVSFSRELKKAGYNPAIFKYTKGATGLARDWKAAGQGGIYDRMVEDLKSAIYALESQGFVVSIRGFIWIQGETDAGNDNSAQDYYFNLKQLIHDLRLNVLNAPNLKIILGVDEQHIFVIERQEVLEAQHQLAEEDVNTIFTSMLGLPKADATHLTPAGLVEHGKRIFEAYFSAFSISSGSEKSMDKSFPKKK